MVAARASVDGGHPTAEQMRRRRCSTMSGPSGGPTVGDEARRYRFAPAVRAGLFGTLAPSLLITVGAGLLAVSADGRRPCARPRWW